jgi:hypothetical protein
MGIISRFVKSAADYFFDKSYRLSMIPETGLLRGKYNVDPTL